MSHSLLGSCLVADSSGAEGWNGLAGQAETIPRAKCKSVEGRLLIRSQEFFLRRLLGTLLKWGEMFIGQTEEQDTLLENSQISSFLLYSNCCCSHDLFGWHLPSRYAQANLPPAYLLHYTAQGSFLNILLLTILMAPHCQWGEVQALFS